MSVSLSCPLGDSFAMITHLFPFVKRFFELFSSFFNFFALASYSLLRVTTARSQLAYLTTFLSFCQLLFAFFFTFGSLVWYLPNRTSFICALWLHPHLLWNSQIFSSEIYCNLSFVGVYWTHIQSRLSRVQCQKDGELPLGRRKQMLFAVWPPHPAEKSLW